MARDRLVGVLTLVHSVPNAFTEEHLELMQAIADQASVAVLNARLYTESQRTARVMTALAEGRGGDQYLAGNAGGLAPRPEPDHAGLAGGDRGPGPDRPSREI